jgi:membrane associated rhomboid family serine protease
MQNVYEKLSIWRLITSVFAFSSTTELIFGAALLYYFRVFERQIGSNKYAVSNFVVMALDTRSSFAHAYVVI